MFKLSQCNIYLKVLRAVGDQFWDFLAAFEIDKE